LARHEGQAQSVVGGWPGIVNPPPDISNAGTVVGSVLAAMSLLAVLGIRYPLKMLPLLLFVVPLAIPWGYVFKQYVKAPKNPWGKQVTFFAGRDT
jgi:hypothetical protein